MIVLVCGGRDYTDAKYLNRRLDELHAELRFTHLIHGNAKGADALADDWAVENGVQPVRCPALWNHHPRQAGPIRNRRMLDLRPQRCIWFPGGSGTADMVRAAEAVGVQCIRGVTVCASLAWYL